VGLVWVPKVWQIAPPSTYLLVFFKFCWSWSSKVLYITNRTHSFLRDHIGCFKELWQIEKDGWEKNWQQIFAEASSNCPCIIHGLFVIQRIMNSDVSKDKKIIIILIFTYSKSLPFKSYCNDHEDWTCQGYGLTWIQKIREQHDVKVGGAPEAAPILKSKMVS